VIKAILFDLDGTVADTAGDLGAAINRLLADEGRAPLAYERIRPIASHGVRGLVGMGFGIGREHPEFESYRKRFLDYYDEHFCDSTALFDGINPLIEAITARGLQWGIVTNKPQRFTDRLVPTLKLSIAPGVVVSGDTVGVPKPDPRPMFHACQQLGVAPADCWFVGDAEFDIAAGRNAGMKTVLAQYGYISDDDRPHEWGADHAIAHPSDLLCVLDNNGV